MKKTMLALGIFSIFASLASIISTLALIFMLGYELEQYIGKTAAYAAGFFGAFNIIPVVVCFVASAVFAFGSLNKTGPTLRKVKTFLTIAEWSMWFLGLYALFFWPILFNVAGGAPPVAVAVWFITATSGAALAALMRALRLVVVKQSAKKRKLA